VTGSGSDTIISATNTSSGYGVHGESDSGTARYFRRGIEITSSVGIGMTRPVEKLYINDKVYIETMDGTMRGFQKYRVMSNDLNTVIANWKKKDTDLPGDCPRSK